MAELVDVETWLMDKLDSNQVGVADRVYSAVAPMDAAYPHVVFQLQAPRDLMVVGARRVWVDGLWLVRAIGRDGTYVDLEAIADAIDTQLHAASGTEVQACVREQPFAMTEVVDGQQYRHLGGIYRIIR
jgi:hypothetical protein